MAFELLVVVVVEAFDDGFLDRAVQRPMILPGLLSSTRSTSINSWRRQGSLPSRLRSGRRRVPSCRKLPDFLSPCLNGRAARAGGFRASHGHLEDSPHDGRLGALSVVSHAAHRQS